MRPPLLLLALVLAAAPAGSDEAGPGDAEEWFRLPATGAEFRVLRDPATGGKSLERADGRLFDTVEQAVAAEEAGLPPLRRSVHPDLWPAVEDPARAAEPLRVVLVMRLQPVHDASLAARTRVAPGIGERLAALRATLGRIADRRDPDPERVLQLGDRMEEEARLLTPGEREESRRLRAEVQERARGMRREILDAARPLADADQAEVVARIQGTPGARLLGRSLVLSAVSAEVPAGRVADLLADLPGVARVLPHVVRRTRLNTAVATVGASTWWGGSYDGSATTRVAVLDTGIDATHPAFFDPGNVSIVAAAQVFLDAGKFDPYFNDNANSTDGIHMHGTHVAGIVASRNATYKGVAPGSALLNAKCGYNTDFGDGALEDADIMAAGDWAADTGADVLNCSFGGPETTDGSSALTRFFDAMADDLGVSVAVAAGNEGPGPGTVGAPADGFNVVTVGSLDDRNTATHADNALSSFSSRGPLDDGRRKPDLCAPGTDITSCSNTWEGGSPDFIASDGTSMATPLAAGSLALLYDYAASWRTEGLKALLLATTRNTTPYPTGPGNDWGWGPMDLASAYASRASVLEGTLSSTGSTYVLLRAPSLAAGKRVALCWNRLVVSNNAQAPVTYRAPVDLDLSVWQESDGASRGSSTSALNSAERVALSSAAAAPVVRVKRSKPFPSGQTSVDWALALEASSGATVAAPPALSCSLDPVPALVGLGHEFTVFSTVSNAGGLAATAPSVTLALPAGYTLLAGSNPRTVATLAASGGTATASWTVRSGGTSSGTATFSASVTSSSYGESFSAASSSIDQSLDVGTPWGAVVLEGGRKLLVGDPAVAALDAQDDFTGVGEMRLRNAGNAWGEWQPFAVSFPWTLSAGNGPRTLEAQVRDLAGNESAVISDDILLVEAGSPSLTAAKSFQGALAPGGESDAFRIGLLAGDVLTVRLRVRPGAKGADFRGALDLLDPEGNLLVGGRWPVGAPKPWISKFPAAVTGDHWILLRPQGADGAAGGTYALDVRVVVPKHLGKREGPAIPSGGLATFPFVAVEGSVLRGKVRGPVTGDLLVRRPDGATVPCPATTAADGSRRIPGFPLGGGTGAYSLLVPAAREVDVSLSIRPPRRTRLNESP